MGGRSPVGHSATNKSFNKDGTFMTDHSPSAKETEKEKSRQEMALAQDQKKKEAASHKASFIKYVKGIVTTPIIAS